MANGCTVKMLTKKRFVYLFGYISGNKQLFFCITYCDELLCRRLFWVQFIHIQYTPCGFPTFRKTPRKIFRAENLPVFPKSVLLGVFSIFPPRTFYTPSVDKLRELRRFSSAELGGNKMAAIDDFNIKLHLAWQFMCSTFRVKNSVIDINYTLHVYKCSCHFLSLSLMFSITWNSKTVYSYYVKHGPLFTFHSKQYVHGHVSFR